MPNAVDPMSDERHELTGKKVLVMTIDGKVYVGTLFSSDRVLNIVLIDAFERAPHEEALYKKTENKGTLLIIGTQVAVVAMLDPEMDEEIDWTKVSAERIPVLKVGVGA
ncbi:Sm-like ribonucleoprotein [Penicillium taxi]|uniref:Sm-like ribonucleoprotein n=1 Tax=Penicillium taxi TaxID=168475 RepID=UPI0025454735|nr:Sm-like ribonucleoprotein [Penicillium taxi]KAJ5902018.1 Sm-like ribonucleoprotein [Penicillium taxi]